MPDYRFVCPNCGKLAVVSMRISEYTANGHICSVCESELVRDVKNFCSEYAVNCSGFYGKKS